MGRIIVSVTLTNPQDHEKTLRCDALVDTGSSFLVLPSAWKDRLGELELLVPCIRSSSSDWPALRTAGCVALPQKTSSIPASARLASGTNGSPTPVTNFRHRTLGEIELETATQATVKGEICGPVKIQLEGFRPIYGEVAFVEMEPRDGLYEPLVGYIVLEQSQAAVDMLGHRLLHVKRADLKYCLCGSLG